MSDRVKHLSNPPQLTIAWFPLYEYIERENFTICHNSFSSMVLKYSLGVANGPGNPFGTPGPVRLTGDIPSGRDWTCVLGPKPVSFFVGKPLTVIYKKFTKLNPNGQNGLGVFCNFFYKKLLLFKNTLLFIQIHFFSEHSIQLKLSSISL